MNVTRIMAATEAVLGGMSASTVIENAEREPRRFPPLPPERTGRQVFPNDAEYQRLLRAFGYTDPAYYPKLFRQETNELGKLVWEPVM